MTKLLIYNYKPLLSLNWLLSSLQCVEELVRRSKWNNMSNLNSIQESMHSLFIYQCFDISAAESKQKTSIGDKSWNLTDKHTHQVISHIVRFCWHFSSKLKKPIRLKASWKYQAMTASRMDLWNFNWPIIPGLLNT